MANDIFQFTLAKTYLDGCDEEKALDGLETMKKLAENGNGEAAYEVGLQYSEGCLVLTDIDEAKKWFRMAVGLGFEAAREKLRGLGEDVGEGPSGKKLDDTPPPPPPPTSDGPAFKCGKCGQAVPMQTVERIDVTGNPELKKKVISGEFFNQVCPHCGQAGIVLYPCIYVDNDASLFIDVCTDRETALNDEDSKSTMDFGGWDEQWRMAGGHNVRVAVGDILALREMIMLVDAGLDPYALAMCKKMVRDQQGFSTSVRLCFMRFDSAQNVLWFGYLDAANGESKSFSVPKLAYDNVYKVIHDADFEPLRMCEVIDEGTIEELLPRVSSTVPPTEEFVAAKAAAKGHDGAAWFNLGVCYYNGDGVNKNPYKAFKCFREGAESGDADAQHALALCYESGFGVTCSSFRAHAWMSKSAELGNPRAMYGLGTYCQAGSCGEEQDFAKAVEWYRKAADAGYGRSHMALGDCYEKGQGVEKDLKCAFEHFKAAVDAGYDDAKPGVERLKSYATDVPPVDPPAPDQPPTPPLPSVDRPPAPLTPRDLIKACADAFQEVARRKGFAIDEIEAKPELDYAEDIIHFYENEPSLADEFGEENIDGARSMVLHWSWRAGIVYGAKLRTEPKTVSSEVVRKVMSEKGSFIFSRDIVEKYFGLDWEKSQAYNAELYAAWQKLFASCVGCANETQLVSCLYYVGFHLGVTMMFERHHVPEGASFTYGKDESLLAVVEPTTPPPPPVPPKDSYTPDEPPTPPVTPPVSEDGEGPTFECPKCHQTFVPKMTECFDLDEHPDLLKRLQDMSAFAQTCPHCHGVSNIAYPTLVRHFQKRYLIRLTFDIDEARAMNRAQLNLLEGDDVGKIRQRVVCGVASFHEKLRIFNQGLDDNIIEAIKLFFLKDAADKNIVNMLFIGIKNGMFNFAIFLKGEKEPKIWGAPGEMYDKLLTELKDAFPENHIRYVSHVTVGKILDGGTDDDKIDENKILDVFAKCGVQMGLLKGRSFNLKGVWRQCAIDIASKLKDAVEKDPEIGGDIAMMRDIGVFAALHIGLGASVEWVANPRGFNAETIYNMMMLEGGFCRVGEIPFEKLASFSNEDFADIFGKYEKTLEVLSKEIAVKTGRELTTGGDAPSPERLGQFWELTHKEFFAAFLCGLNAGLLLQNEGAQLDVKGGVSVQLDYGRYMNLALAQNKCPLVSNLKIKNVTEEKVEGLICRISSPDEFFQSKEIELGPLWPGAESELGAVKLNYNVALLRRLEDQQPGLLRLEIVSGDETLFCRDYEVTALAADQSHSIFGMPIFLASFVKPNCEAIKQLQPDVAKEMQLITGGDATLAGYQADRDHVFKMCAAMYRAIQKKGIAYSNPPESFDLPGQKIRMPDTVMKYKMATCLDSTILFASIMESCMLHPVLILISGHAFVGCFLSDSHLPQVETRDPQVLRKLIASGDFIAIETTKVTSDTTFEDAERLAREGNLAAERDEGFVCAVDVAAARHGGVRPLALGSGAEDAEFIAEGHDVEQKSAGHLRQIKSVDLSKLKKAEAPTGRVAVWAQKLLDLSPTNKLLNAKESKDVLRLSCPNPAVLEDWLASGDEIPVRSVAEAFSTKDVEDVKAHKLTNERVRQIIETEFACKRLCVEEGPRVVMRSLRNLYKLGQNDLEETGVHTLFVGIGFLRWRDSKKRANAKAYEAPLILVPIRIGKTATDEGICISKRDDETVINTTLLQFLRASYGIEVPGLDPLPEDDAGLDVPHIMQIFRECVKKAKDVEVVDQAAIGHFSFGKFAMWRDLMENSEELKKSPLVNHLISAGGQFSDGIEVFAPNEVAQHLNPSEMFCPVSADSSQLTAVLYSALGKSFVLYGPPGTGKSQTITNMIAHNLAIGRRVLFVSEKKAALDVVHKRLKEVGLEPFCLELHSNKGDKGSVMRQFTSSLEVSRSTTTEEWKRAADQICTLRDDLAGYVEALHHRYPNRLTAYDCFARALEKGDPKYQELITANCLTQTWEELEEQKNALRTIITEIENVPDRSALQAIPKLKETQWSLPYEKGLKAASEGFAASAQKVLSAYAAVREQFSLPEGVNDEDLARTVELLNVFKSEKRALTGIGSEGITPEKLKAMMDEAEARQKRMAEAVAKREAAEEALLGWDIEKLQLIDFKSVRERIEEVTQSSFLTRHFKESGLLKEFAELKKSLGRLTIQDLLGAFTKMETLKSARKAIVALQTEFDAGRDEKDESDNETSELSDDLLARIDDVLQAWETYRAARTTFLEYVEKDVCGNAPADCKRIAENLAANVTKVRYVSRYRPFRNMADHLGVGGFADLFESGVVPGRDLLGVFDDAYLGKMLTQVEEASPILPGFFGRSHESKIEQFHRLVDKYSELSEKAIFAKIAARYPDFDGGHFTKEENRQLGSLKREINKKRNQMPVRKLLAENGDLVAKFKPCFLMSPLSVAQFLDMEMEPFDLIIFDEASQIEVCDAIGVIARGKQVVVVGDPQQMPPTNFFGSSSIGGLEKEVEDAESILVECLDVGLPKTYLNWHYRSRHESLIAFSNHNYYEDELNSFPSVSESERLGVRYHYVKNGVYGHGTNPNEAQAVVDYVCKRVKSASYKKRPRSIGIVTFNMQQQEVIEEMMIQRCSEDAEVKAALCGGDIDATPENGQEQAAQKSDEKMFFVRNLENVQGDEADVIIFSITFGPDENGRISMNFGPLNREGGERRLNVAVTRAREQMVVFSSMKYTNIKTDEDTARGARGLRDFLEYAETGSRSSSCKAATKVDPGFSTLVANFLTEHGYQVVRNVGYSGYKIDMAVLNPFDAKEYILGIECDGPSYARQLTVRDRDVLRASVLRRGGWKMCRVWCAEWYHDRAGAEARLLKLLESLKPEKPVQEEPEDDTPAEITVVPPVIDEKRDEDIVIKKDDLPPAPPTPPVQPPVVPPQPPVPPHDSPVPPPCNLQPPAPPPVPPTEIPVVVTPPVVVPPAVPPTPPSNDDELKIGKVVQRVFPVLFAEGRITDADIAYLLSEAASKYFKTGGYPVMKETTGDPDQDSRDASGAHRFYGKIVLGFNGKRYLVTSQWFAQSLELLISWLAQHGISRDRVVEIYRQVDAAKATPVKDDGSGRAGKTTIRVTFPDGTVFEGRKAADVFVAAIVKLGPAEIAALKIMHCGEPLVTSNLADYVKYAKGAKSTGTGWYVNTYSSTQAKAQFLERIARALSVALTVAIVPCDPIADQPVSPFVPPVAPPVAPEPEVKPVVPVEPSAPPVPPETPPTPPDPVVSPVAPPLVPVQPPSTPPAPPPVKEPEVQPTPPVQPPTGNAGGIPLTEQALMPVRSPLALLLDGERVRVVSSWKDCYLALCEKLQELDQVKFDSLPEQPAFRRFFLKVTTSKARCADCYPAKFGSQENIRVKEIATKSYFYMPTYVVFNLLKFFKIDPSRVTIQP